MSRAAQHLPLHGPTPELREYQRLIREDTIPPYAFLQLLGLPKPDPQALLAVVERGLPYRAFERLQRNAGLTAQELALVVDIPARTLQRRKAQGRLDPGESDRLARFARMLGRALELFEGDPERARRWLASELPALRDRRPLDLARTDVGTLEVEHLIGRLEHGIPS